MGRDLRLYRDAIHIRDRLEPIADRRPALPRCCNRPSADQAGGAWGCARLGRVAQPHWPEAGKAGSGDDFDNAPRQYLGYIVRVYYQDELQAVRADPTRLLNLFPPPCPTPPQ